MPRSQKLKVYRTPIGFHDAYVAAPSQKAAIEAWGSSKDIFSRGEAEIVTDPELTAEPLASPGKVIKRLRGTAAEQIAALPPEEQPRARRPAPDEAEEPVARTRRTAPAKAAKPKPPRPSREELEAAEAAIAEAEKTHKEELQSLADRQAELDHDRRETERRQVREMERLEAERDKRAKDYESAIRRWRG